VRAHGGGDLSRLGRGCLQTGRSRRRILSASAPGRDDPAAGGADERLSRGHRSQGSEALDAGSGAPAGRTALRRRRLDRRSAGTDAPPSQRRLGRAGRRRLRRLVRAAQESLSEILQGQGAFAAGAGRRLQDGRDRDRPARSRSAGAADHRKERTVSPHRAA
uniref:Transcriptional regulator, PadR family n=1 Tax=Parastrongyloides trichosuri TaxID=131310 RepID=A0A0N5A0U8_PARTI